MDMRDVKINSYRNSSERILMEITHIPTGLIASGDGSSEFMLRARLISKLEERVKTLNK